ncbi:MAG: hypothetical protein ABSH33_09240 [Steroidobacteraceae bacterium]|jgi:hypothetical protein
MDKTPTQPKTPQRQQAEQLISMLAVIVAQIQSALLETNGPAATLVESAYMMGSAAQTVARCLFDFSGSPARVFQDLMLLHDELQAKGSKSVTAVQFHDRLVQCLTHVCASLACLTEFLSTGADSKSPAEWSELHERVRGILRMGRAPSDSSGASGDSKESAAANRGANVELF